jgi:glycosyltransferase involved in cell wall biosynthesis
LNDDPTIAVVIPVYKGENLIKVALDSVIKQSHQASEIIVVDDGSPDESGAIAASYGEMVTVIRQENGGMASARNTAIQNAKSTWIAFLDHDDACEPDRLKKVLEAALSNPSAKWIYSDYIKLNSLTQTRTYETTPEPSVCEQNNRYVCSLVPSFCAIRRDALLEIGGFAESREFIGVEDHILLIKFMRKHGAGVFVRVPEALSTYTLHHTNQHRRIWDQYAKRVALLNYQVEDLMGVKRWIWRRILLALLDFNTSVLMREQGDKGYFKQAALSLFQWPFVHRALPISRYKIFAHMLLTELGIISLRRSVYEKQ